MEPTKTYKLDYRPTKKSLGSKERARSESAARCRHTYAFAAAAHAALPAPIPLGFQEVPRLRGTPAESRPNAWDGLPSHERLGSFLSTPRHRPGTPGKSSANTLSLNAPTAKDSKQSPIPARSQPRPNTRCAPSPSTRNWARMLYTILKPLRFDAQLQLERRVVLLVLGHRTLVTSRATVTPNVTKPVSHVK